MVSLKQRQNLAALSETDPYLKSIKMLLDGESPSPTNANLGGIHGELLLSIATKDPIGFKNCAENVGNRRISSESDWCHDDFLLFLLLLGNQKFGRPLKFLAKVIEVRSQNPNPLPRKINEVFSALEREEFGIDGEFGFLKIPYLYLIGNLRLEPSDARKAIQAMSAVGLHDQMTPFLKLLTQKAYDLVLIDRQPIAAETTAQVIKAIERHAKDFSIRDWWLVITALPGRMIWALIILIAVSFPVLFGFGKSLTGVFFTKEIRNRPEGIAIASIREPGSKMPHEALLISKSLPLPVADPTKHSLLVEVEALPFTNATPDFVVEISHSEKDIRNSFAFTQSPDLAPSSFTVVPVQRDSGRFRALLPKQAVGNRLFFVLEFEAATNENTVTIGPGLNLRCLQ